MGRCVEEQEARHRAAFDELLKVGSKVSTTDQQKDESCMGYPFMYFNVEKRRYPIWVERETVYTDPYWDMAGGYVHYIRSNEYPIPKEMIHDGKISKQDFLSFLDSIHERVPEEKVPDWINLTP